MKEQMVLGGGISTSITSVISFEHSIRDLVDDGYIIKDKDKEEEKESEEGNVNASLGKKRR